MHTRNNHRLANIVEQGIIIDTLSGAVDAWNFLSTHAVPEHIIVRVLLHPAMRRPSDNAFHHSLIQAESAHPAGARHEPA